MSTIERVEVTVPVTWKETRSGASRKIGGTAAVFGQTADRLGFAERIQRGAFADTITRHDPFLVYSHNDDAILARKSAGTLTLSEGPNGLNFDATIVNTTVGNDVLELVRTGHLTECSFAMSDVDDEWIGDERVITRVGQLHEITVCPLGAYSQTSVEARSSVSERIQRVTGVRPQPKTSRDAYSGSQTGKHSFWLDLARVQSEGEARTFFGGPKTSYDDVDVEQARNRLTSLETRAGVNTSLTSGGEFGGGTALPADVANAYAIGARTASVVEPLFTHEPLTNAEIAGSTSGTTHMLVKIPRIGTGGTVTVMSADGATVSNTDLVTNQLTAPVGTISGNQLLSYQIFDLSNPSIDLVIAKEFGSLISEKTDDQLLNGTSSSGQTTGLQNVVGPTSVAYTDASPTAGELLTIAAQTWSQTFTARGIGPNVIIANPRRAAWLLAGTDAQNLPIVASQLTDADDVTLAAGQPLATISPGMRLYASPKVVTNQGAGTNQDPLYFIRREDMLLYASGVKFLVSDQSNPTTGQLRITAYRYIAAFPGIYGSGVGIVTGTGTVPPAGY